MKLNDNLTQRGQRQAEGAVSTGLGEVSGTKLPKLAQF
jgi:hypothetical protein